MGGDGGEWEVMVAAESGAEIEGSQQGSDAAAFGRLLEGAGWVCG